MASKTLTVMFVDMVDFTSKSTMLSRNELLELIEDFENLLLPVIERFGGTLIKKIGDALLATFESPTNAVICSIWQREVINLYNQQQSFLSQMKIRIALNTGDVELRENDILGEPINLASRIESITPESCIYLSEVVYLSMNRAEVPLKEVGYRKFKGFTDSIRIFEVDCCENSINWQSFIRDLRHSTGRQLNFFKRPVDWKEQIAGLQNDFGYSLEVSRGVFSLSATKRFASYMEIVQSPFSNLFNALKNLIDTETDFVAFGGLLCALAACDNSAAVPLIMPYLKSREPRLRSACMQALALTEDMRSNFRIQRVMMNFLSDSEAPVVQSVITAFRESLSRNMIVDIVAQYFDFDQEINSWGSLVIIEELRLQECISTVRSCLASPFPRVRAKADLLLNRLENLGSSFTNSKSDNQKKISNQKESDIEQSEQVFSSAFFADNDDYKLTKEEDVFDDPFAEIASLTPLKRKKIKKDRQKKEIPTILLPRAEKPVK